MADVFIEKTPLKRNTGRKGHEDRRRDWSHVPAAKEAKVYGKPPEDRRARKPSSLGLQREHSYANTSIFNLGFQSGVTFKFLVFKSPSVWSVITASPSESVEPPTGCAENFSYQSLLQCLFTPFFCSSLPGSLSMRLRARLAAAIKDHTWIEWEHSHRDLYVAVPGMS